MQRMLEGWPWMTKIHTEERPKRCSEKVIISKPRGEASEETKPADTLILGFSASRMVSKRKFLLFKPPRLTGILSWQSGTLNICGDNSSSPDLILGECRTFPNYATKVGKARSSTHQLSSSTPGGLLLVTLSSLCFRVATACGWWFVPDMSHWLCTWASPGLAWSQEGPGGVVYPEHLDHSTVLLHWWCSPLVNVWAKLLCAKLGLSEKPGQLTFSSHLFLSFHSCFPYCRVGYLGSRYQKVI